jgi:hypothetical protein
VSDVDGTMLEALEDYVKRQKEAAWHLACNARAANCGLLPN